MLSYAPIWSSDFDLGARKAQFDTPPLMLREMMKNRSSNNVMITMNDRRVIFGQQKSAID